MLEAARAVRPHLAELLPAPEADAIDSALAAVLNSGSAPGGMDDKIAEVLRRQSSVQEWAAAFTSELVAGPVAERGYSGLPGDPRPGEPVRYACPRGDFVFYRRTPAIAVPDCLTHHIPLVPAAR